MYTLGEYVTLGEVRFAFRPGKSVTDLNAGSFRVMNANELNKLNQNYAVNLSVADGSLYSYGYQEGGQPRPERDALNGPGFEQSKGIRVSGTVRTYNPKNATTVKLIQDGAEVYRTVIGVETGDGRKDQSFTFEGIASGTYSLLISKPLHTDFIVQSLVVGGGDVDLARDSRADVQLMALRCGDINGDGVINDVDLTILWMAVNYNKNTDQAADPRCDLNGDGYINEHDLSILWTLTNYNKGAKIIE